MIKIFKGFISAEFVLLDGFYMNIEYFDTWTKNNETGFNFFVPYLILRKLYSYKGGRNCWVSSYDNPSFIILKSILLTFTNI